MSLVEGYKALSDENRLRILSLLSQASLNVQEITSILGLSQSTVSHHLRILQQAGMIAARKHGTWSYYTLKLDPGAPVEHQLLSGFLSLSHHRNGDTLGAKLGHDGQSVQELLRERRDQARQYFETVAPEWDLLRSKAQSSKDYLDVLAEQVASDESLLELGCGSGAFLKRVLPRAGITIGVDYSQAMIDAASRALSSQFQNLDLRLGYLEHLPISDGTIEVAVAYMVFRHIAEPREVLREVCRVLKDGGRLIVVDHLPHEDEARKKQFAEIWMGFSPEEFSAWSEAEGFSLHSIELLGEEENVFMLTVERATK
ncbi:MAG: ArsR family transcriptional regulator [Bdellovibrionales bacterium]|nr:ArsR family transcriptional regulator [Bdellovibrionales bacterium]